MAVPRPSRPTQRPRAHAAVAPTAGRATAAVHQGKVDAEGRPLFYTPPQVAAILGWSPPTIIAQIKAGRLRADTLPGEHRDRYHILPDALDEFRLQCNKTSTAGGRDRSKKAEQVQPSDTPSMNAGLVAARYLLDGPFVSERLRCEAGDLTRVLDVTALLPQARGPLERMLLQVARAFQEPKNGAISFGEMLRAFDAATLTRLALALVCYIVLLEQQDGAASQTTTPGRSLGARGSTR